MSVGIEYTCAFCNGKVLVPHSVAWPIECPHCKTTPPHFLFKQASAGRSSGEAAPDGEKVVG